jgi:hypothetical protein
MSLSVSTVLIRAAAVIREELAWDYLSPSGLPNSTVAPSRWRVNWARGHWQ